MKSIIALFTDYMKEAKSCDDFILWTALSTVAGSVGRKIWVSRNGYQIYPNLYVLLVGSPGSTYKTSAIRNASHFLTQVPGSGVLPENMTPAAMLYRMSDNSRKTFADVQGKSFTSGNSYIYSGEVVNILGKSKYGNMLNILTELYDCDPNGWGHEKAWIKETMSGGEVKIFNPCVNLLGATTPGAMHKDIITKDEINSGFTSRLLIIYDSVGSLKKAVWLEDDEIEPKHLVEKEIVSRLTEISKLSGPMKVSKEVMARHLDFMEINETYIKSISDTRVQSFCGRKPTSILKLATVISLSYSTKMELETEHWDLAHKLILDVEKKSNSLFVGIGENKQAKAIKDVFSFIKIKGKSSIGEIASFMWKDLDSKGIDEVINLLYRMKKISYDPINKVYVVLDSADLN